MQLSGKTKKVYIAASFPLKAEARRLRDELQKHGIVVTSRWLDGTGSYGGTTTLGERDIEDILTGDTLICMTGDSKVNDDLSVTTFTRGGRHSEFGMALITGRRCIVFGPPEQVFHHHKNVEQVNWIGVSDAASRNNVAALLAIL